MADRLVLPKLQSVKLRHFSIWPSAQLVDVNFPDGVYCLAGANGLGKSTFLAALNYGITGIVPEPGRKFDSVEEYYKYNLKFAGRFFNGRIAEQDRDMAEVTVELLVGNTRFNLTRGMFETLELRSLSIYLMSDGNSELVYDGTDKTPEDRHNVFTTEITSAVGLDSFAQLVFIQCLVLTFDERRHMLFWDQDVLEQCLYIAFGLDATQARQADQLRRDAEKAGSLARNANWQATEIRKKLLIWKLNFRKHHRHPLMKD